MAKLFSHKLLQENIATLSIPDREDKIAVLQTWVNAIQNKSINKKTESECEQAFNMDIFHKVLGYTLYPTEQYTLEAKGGNEISGQKADATLGCFTTSDIEKNVSRVQVVVEIKDANTPLEKSQRRDGNLSPVQQGFKYKPQYTDCKWVLVTNFIEIRLYKDTQLDFEIWQLTDLVNPENDFQSFKIFWYILNAKHLISSLGNQSVTEKILSAVRLQTEQITKKFYQEYKALRLELINDIRTHNTTVHIDTILPKAQKIIDRIVFVHFCEDFGLLPEGKLAEVIQYSEQLVGVTIWQILSGFFEAVNSGSGKLGIPNGYNGGLFHEDKELNDLKIGDTICRKFVELGKYDFQEDLSVNILGHIFEQSISDLEDLRINMLGTEIETGELGESTKSNKRKKDGIFYTPEYIVDYIVKNSLGKYLEEQFEAIEKKHLKNEKKLSDKVYKEKQQLIYGEYKQLLETITVLDPACGSGAFLVNVFDYLLAEHKRIGDGLGMGNLFDNESTYKSILQNNIYGVDLNAESVEITKLSLWLKTAEKGKKLADLDKNIKCGNSLIDDPEVAGDKAFDRNTEFATIMNKGGFDVVVGNPPYVDIKAISKSIVEYYFKVFESCHNRINLYAIFIEKGLQLLKTNGKLGFIFPSSLLMNSSYEKLRNILLSRASINEVIKLPDNIFEDVKMETMILIFSSKNKIDNKVKIRNYLGDTSIYNIDTPTTLVNQYDWNIDGCEFNLNLSNLDSKLIHKLEQYSKVKPLSYFCNFSLGITPYDKYKGHSEHIIKSKAFHTSSKEDESCKPLINGGDIKRYFVSCDFSNYIKYGNWLGATRDENFFAGEHLVMRQIVTNNRLYLCYDKGGFYNTQIGFNLVSKGISIKYILVILNSTFISWYHSKKFLDMTKTLFQKILIENAKKIPIFEASKQEQQPFIEKADMMLALNKEFYEKIDFTTRFLQSKFHIEKPSTKLSKFRELDFSGFVKELKIKKLPLDTEAELMRYFEKEKAEIVALKAQINALDKIIDDMVFDLYGLTEDERKVVLES